MKEYKWHYRINDGNLCGRGNSGDSTFTESIVTCKICKRMLPDWKAGNARIEKYEAAHIARVTFEIPMKQWSAFLNYMKRSEFTFMRTVSFEVGVVYKCLQDSDVVIK